jgi:hypothetical protein
MKHIYKTKGQRKAQLGHIEEGKNRKTNKWHEKRQTKEKAKKSLSSKTPPNTLNASSPP